MHTTTQPVQDARKRLREVDQDKRDGRVITLLWDSHKDRLTLVIDDYARDTFYQGHVPKERGRHAMEHPFLYVGEPS